MLDSRIQTELRKRSNNKLGAAEKTAGEAIERAAKADLARIELEAELAPRMLSKAQYDALQTLKGQVNSVIITTTGNIEARRFADQIAQTLADVGIDVRMGHPRIGMSWSSIYVVMPKAETILAKNVFFIAFKKAEISAGVGDRTQFPMADLPDDVPVIMVGEKPFAYPRPPLVWLPTPENAQNSNPTETSTKRE
jgi:hypothetical protein